MFSPIIRILIVILSLFLASNYFQVGSDLSGYLMLLAAGLTIWGYFKNGTVYRAWQAVKKEQFVRAEKILNQTRYPQLLKKEQRGFYHFIKGFIEEDKQNSDGAYSQFTEALKFSVRTENNLAIIHLHLASIEIERGKFGEAQEHLKVARRMKHDPILEPELLKLENKIKI